MFLTTHSTPWGEARAKLDEKRRPSSASHHELVGIEFTKVLDGLGIERSGVSFAAGRHTFRSIAGEHRDAEAVRWIMRHSQVGVSRWYVHKNERMLSRLASVAITVRAHLML